MHYNFPLIFGQTFYLYDIVLSLGDEMIVDMMGRIHPNCVFIKVTRKGFNILDIDTNRVILKKHLYAPKMKDKEYHSQGPIRACFRVPSYVNIKKKPSQSVSAS